MSYGPSILLASDHVLMPQFVPGTTSRFCVPTGLCGRGRTDIHDVMGRINNFPVIRMREGPLFSGVVYNDMALLPTTKTQNIYQPLFLVCTAHFCF